MTSVKSLETQRAELEESLPEVDMEVVRARDNATSLVGELSELRQRLSNHQNAAKAAGSRILFNEERCRELQERIETNRGDLEAGGEKLAQQELDFNVSKDELHVLHERIEERSGALVQ